MFLVRRLALVAVGTIGLAGCATYDPYYGASLGIGSRYYDPYHGAGYGGYAPYGGYVSYGSPYGGYASPYGGWYSGYYYPGTGAYVYDPQRRRHPISDAQRHYWGQQRVLRSGNAPSQGGHGQYLLGHRLQSGPGQGQVGLQMRHQSSRGHRPR